MIPDASQAEPAVTQPNGVVHRTRTLLGRSAQGGRAWRLLRDSGILLALVLADRGRWPAVAVLPAADDLCLSTR
jgi:hypothetical protein